MIVYLLDNPATLAAFLSFIATLLAAIATWRGPRSAALLAEKIRHEKEASAEIRRMRMHVFSTLMQERATIASVDSVRMLNSIDFVFNDVQTVREAWAELYILFQTDGPPHPQLKEEKLRTLLKTMASSLGMSGNLKVNDLGRIYYPNALAIEDEIRRLKQEQALSSMRPQPAEQSVFGQDMLNKFPPMPS